jgi:single-stranded DNA-binding protein
MAADNQTTIAGNLVETPELRFTNTGTPVTNLRVAVTQRIQQDGKRSVAEIEADEVGASLKFATAKVERATERATSDRAQGRERQEERGGDFGDQPPTY